MIHLISSYLFDRLDHRFLQPFLAAPLERGQNGPKISKDGLLNANVRVPWFHVEFHGCTALVICLVEWGHVYDPSLIAVLRRTELQIDREFSDLSTRRMVSGSQGT